MLSSVEKRHNDKCLSLFPAQLKWIKVFVRKKTESLPSKFFSGSIYLIFCPASPMWQPDAKEQTRWDFMTNADYILASIFTSDIISYDSNPKSKWPLFFFPNAPCSSTSGSNLFLVLPSFLYSGKFIRPPISQRNKIIRLAPSYDYQVYCPILGSVVSAFFEGDYCLCSPASSPSCLIRYGRSSSFRPLLSQWKKVDATTLTCYRYRNLQWWGNNHCTSSSVDFSSPMNKIVKMQGVALFT